MDPAALSVFQQFALLLLIAAALGLLAGWLQQPLILACIAFVATLGALGERCLPLLAYGPPGLLLAHEAQRQHADLVVLGSRRKGPMEAALLGSVASNPALMVTADALLVREALASAAS